MKQNPVYSVCLKPRNLLSLSLAVLEPLLLLVSESPPHGAQLLSGLPETDSRVLLLDLLAVSLLKSMNPESGFLEPPFLAAPFC